ncbi:hypothetical protein [Nocardioides pocheonensis]|jgi:hypothetical protein|uniref:Uncharacterized protein n=1 Tax=Nocardioides pocheonensis TaxID=661485 RepID=A0A3N0GJE2_9ACTN|nr:hypothetical protein [Nocardioides pocheonensis]RNM12559.1 hypothetical protein EFL26_18215 [Nocardioides pocheonensis]
MSPLQRIAMGLVIVFLPANFPHHPHPAWAFYDALPDPVGWLLVVTGVRRLRPHLDVDVLTWLAWVSFAISVPLWFPQLNHLLVPEYNDSIDVSLQWFLSLPQTVFSLALARTIGRTAELQEPRDTFVAGRFGVLTWGFAALVVLPAIAYGGGVDALVDPTLLGIGLVNVAFIYYLFRVHRREWLGGPGPLEIHPRAREDR